MSNCENCGKNEKSETSLTSKTEAWARLFLSVDPDRLVEMDISVLETAHSTLSQYANECAANGKMAVDIGELVADQINKRMMAQRVLGGR